MTHNAYTYVGKRPVKRVHSMVFKPNETLIVYDPKTERLIKTLPGFEFAGEAEMVFSGRPSASQKASGASVPAKPAQAFKPSPIEEPKEVSAPITNEYGIPADWREAHNATRRSWGAKIYGQEVRSTEEADSIIAIYMGEE